MSMLQIDVIRCEQARDCNPILKQVGRVCIVGYANELNEYIYACMYIHFLKIQLMKRFKFK